MIFSNVALLCQNRYWVATWFAIFSYMAIISFQIYNLWPSLLFQKKKGVVNSISMRNVSIYSLPISHGSWFSIPVVSLCVGEILPSNFFSFNIAPVVLRNLLLSKLASSYTDSDILYSLDQASASKVCCTFSYDNMHSLVTWLSTSNVAYGFVLFIITIQSNKSKFLFWSHSIYLI